MATIDIRRKHGRTPTQAKALVDKTVAGVGEKFGVSSQWDGDALHIKRKGIDGEIRVTKTEVIVHAELGFLFGAMKPMIEREIAEQLDKNFG